MVKDNAGGCLLSQRRTHFWNLLICQSEVPKTIHDVASLNTPS